ncbi:MAG: histidine phosphatase family protein, partial [Thermoanaerobaculia bacterium]|nr:histidine phosphatase family protein [Thermoanaerobaculia bacterium]
MKRSQTTWNVASRNSGSLLFLRHGHTVRSSDYYMDEEDVVLSSEGRREALALSPLLIAYRPELLIVSTVRRCRETALVATQDLRAHIIYEVDLRERAFQALFGWQFEQIRKTYGQVVEGRLRNRGELLSHPGVESIEDAQARVVNALNRHIEQCTRLAVISHGGPHSWFCCHVEKRPLEGLRGYELAPKQAHRDLKRSGSILQGADLAPGASRRGFLTCRAPGIKLDLA